MEPQGVPERESMERGRQGAPLWESDDVDASARALLDTFDGRLTAAERRMERLLARLGVD